jgi:hypothetical protein
MHLQSLLELLARRGTALLLLSTAAGVAAASPAALPPTSTGGSPGAVPSAEAARVARWAVSSRDNKGQPFAVIDKRNARLLVYEASGKLRGSAPVLLGLAKGDDTVPGIGNRPLSDVKPYERTTPAGRFAAEHGTNLRKEDILWIDYDAAVSMHPVLTTNAKERRLQRLATPGTADNRISYGCVNVPKAFFSNVVLKTLKSDRPMIYVLPETRPLESVFAGLSGSRLAGANKQQLAGAAAPARKP